MNQRGLGRGLTAKRTGRRESPAAMKREAPWARLVDLVTPNQPERKRRRSPFEVLLRIHVRLRRFDLSELATEVAIAGPCSTKGASGGRKGQQWCCGLRAHLGADAGSGLVHTVRVLGMPWSALIWIAPPKGSA